MAGAHSPTGKPEADCMSIERGLCHSGYPFLVESTLQKQNLRCQVTFSGTKVAFALKDSVLACCVELTHFRKSALFW